MLESIPSSSAEKTSPLLVLLEFGTGSGDLVFGFSSPEPFAATTSRLLDRALLVDWAEALPSPLPSPKPFIMASKSISLAVSAFSVFISCAEIAGELSAVGAASLDVLELSLVLRSLDRRVLSFFGFSSSTVFGASSFRGSLGTSFSHHKCGFFVKALGYLSAFA